MQDVRDRMGDYVRRCCGTMQVLDMTQPIELGNIYTDVNILEKLTGRQRLGIDELMQRCTLENFDRVQLGKVTEKRISGIDAANKYPHMMVWGKPGAGKTTFLKYLAISCMGGEFQGDRVPVFITLRNWASDSNKLNLLEFVSQELANYDVTNNSTVGLFKQGRVLLLLDGLDEVLKEDSHRVIRQIQSFSDRYHRNVIVVTCRIAAREYTFQGFTEVEVADFDDRQIQSFVRKWFQDKSPKNAEEFIEKLKDNKAVKELANNPLLLTMLCLVFEDKLNFPSNRAKIYSKGFNIMLEQWDKSRGIERDIIYKKLSTDRKKCLLSDIAWNTFEKGEYFFDQDLAKKYIADYIINLPEAQTDPEALLVDSEAVLKSIESQHGLLVKRAEYIDSLYSFSHLSFQEYFAARRAIATDATLSELANYTDERRWREVFLLALGILQDGSELLRLMKQQIDNLVAADEKIQQVLVWLKNKSASIETTNKPAAIKAFYLDLYFDLDLYLDLDRVLYLDRVLDLDLDLYLDLYLYLDFYLDFGRVLDRALEFKLKKALHQLKQQLPDLEDRDNFKNWWRKNGSAWAEQLRAIMIKYCNIGHDWQLKDKQKELLRKYRYANKFLLDCLNSDCYVSREVRQEIEDTLYLPISDIRKRHKQPITERSPTLKIISRLWRGLTSK